MEERFIDLLPLPRGYSVVETRKYFSNVLFPLKSYKKGLAVRYPLFIHNMHYVLDRPFGSRRPRPFQVVFRAKSVPKCGLACADS